ncbi:MAG: hypothetical protein CMI60_01440 [Parvibaculum sp.]|nr:hypothetical protein [Parvibaculum sp.]
MNTIHQFASIAKNLSGTSASLADLAYNYKSVAPRTALDDAHIDVLVAEAEGMIAAANALKSVEYEPTPEPDPDPE